MILFLMLQASGGGRKNVMSKISGRRYNFDPRTGLAGTEAGSLENLIPGSRLDISWQNFCQGWNHCRDELCRRRARKKCYLRAMLGLAWFQFTRKSCEVSDKSEVIGDLPGDVQEALELRDTAVDSQARILS